MSITALKPLADMPVTGAGKLPAAPQTRMSISPSCSRVWRSAVSTNTRSIASDDAGETTADGLFTLRTVECYGGCGWGPVVSVDERYHEPFPPDRVKPLLDELRGAQG